MKHLKFLFKCIILCGWSYSTQNIFIFVSKRRAIKLNNYNSTLKNQPTQKTLNFFYISTIIYKLTPHDKSGKNNQLVVMEKNPRFKKLCKSFGGFIYEQRTFKVASIPMASP
jgi:hypothetical protein